MKGYLRGIKNKAIRLIIELSRKFKIVKKHIVNVSPSRFLVVSTTGIGDTLWGTPAIRVLKETSPNCYIGVLTTETGAELLKDNPYIDDIFLFKRGLRLFFLLRLLKKLRQQRFHCAFIFHTSDRIILPLVFFAEVPLIIGITGQNKGLDFILTEAIPQEDLHGVEMRLRLLQEIGVFCGNSLYRPALYLSYDDRRYASAFLKDIGFDKNSLVIGFHPGAQKPFKCWPAERFIETGKRLVKEFDCSIILTGSQDEKELCEKIATQIEGAISIAGKTTLRRTAAIIEKMQLFITNDTGPMHIAFALGTPTIALFCPTDPRLCGPYKVEDAIVLKKPVTCDPCIGKNCLIPTCMDQITVEEVLTAIKEFMHKVSQG